MDLAPVGRRRRVSVVADTEFQRETARPTVLRLDIQDEIVSRLGAARTTTFLFKLLEQCEALRAMLARPHDDLAARAHDLTSTAGMLGYEELSLGCSAMMAATGATEHAAARAALEGTLQRAISILHQQTRSAEAA